MAKTKNYLNKKDLLDEIYKSREQDELTKECLKMLMLLANKTIRKLTPKECFRLMGVYDFKQVVSNTQLYKQAGNSIVVDVLAAIINKLKL